jgi:hypothetical protein
VAFMLFGRLVRIGSGWWVVWLMGLGRIISWARSG